MRDFSCCGLILPSLHDLLQHYEEAHAEAQKSTHQNNNTTEEPVMPDSRAAIATNTAASVQQEAQRQQQFSNFKPIAPAQATQQPNTNHPVHQRPSGFSSTLQTIPDMDTVEDMEMDDVEEMEEKTPPPNLYTKGAAQQSPRPQFNAVTQPRIPQLNMNTMQSQALRNSTPSTPTTQGRTGGSMYNNPSVSAVNTPTLTGNPMQQQFQDIHGQQYHATPDSSTPGTPAELDDNIIDGMDDMSMQNNPFYLNQSQNFNYGAFGNNDMLDLCIDEPAKRLFSTTGGFNPQSQSQSQSQGHMRLGSGQYGPNSDLARRIREQQMLAGLPDTTTGLMPHDEPKPFRCPVIGCEKAYKNQNGLKYHKSVGHVIIPSINPSY
jgi:transcription factor SFP1